MRPNQYLVVTGRRQLKDGRRWISLPSPADVVVKRGRNGQSPTHFTLQFFLRSVDKGEQSRVELVYRWKQAAGEPGSAGDRVWATRKAFTKACTIP